MPNLRDRFIIMVYKIVIISIIVSIGLFYIVFTSDSFVLSLLVYILSGIYIIGITVFMVLRGLDMNKRYIKNLVMTKPKKRFKYLDSFYYYKKVDFDSISKHFVYHIIEDVDSKKIYVITEHGTNIIFEKILDKAKVFRVGDMDSISARKDWKEVNYGDEGSFWIDKELTDCYNNDGENVIINYSGEKHKLKNNSVTFIINNSIDISLLDKATFIMGYAQLDNK